MPNFAKFLSENDSQMEFFGLLKADSNLTTLSLVLYDIYYISTSFCYQGVIS